MLKERNYSDDKYLYTMPIFKSRAILVGSENSAYIHSGNNMNTYDIDILKNSKISSYLKRNYSNENIYDRFNSTDELIKALKNEQVDYIALNSYVFNDL